MNKLRKIFFLSMIVIFAFCFCSCQLGFKSDEEKIRDRVEEFIFAYNSGDVDGAFDCLDAKSKQTYKAMMNIGNGLFGKLTGIDISVQDLFAIAVGVNGSDILSMDIKNIAITSETTATVDISTTLSLDVARTSETNNNMQLQMVKEKDDWFIYAQADWDSILS